jgi:hypothetical protein
MAYYHDDFFDKVADKLPFETRGCYALLGW